jgi:hypothetical protein
MSSYTPAPWPTDPVTLRQFAVEIAQSFPRGYTDQMIAANMRLILAAPKLLEALIAMREAGKYWQGAKNAAVLAQVDEALAAAMP